MRIASSLLHSKRALAYGSTFTRRRKEAAMDVKSTIRLIVSCLPAPFTA